MAQLREGQTGSLPDGTKVMVRGGRVVPLASPGKIPVMPGGVVNKLNDDIDAIGTTSAINARLEPYRQDLDAKKLDLGPIRNLVMQGQNAIGMSSPQSVEFASFRSDLEKLRNDSLRLNKGTQTEGDAQRAWNELFSNMTDEKLVAARLAQIQQYNDQAIKLKKGVVDSTRGQYGMGPADYSKADVPRDAYVKKTGGQVQTGGGVKPSKMSDDQIKSALGLK